MTEPTPVRTTKPRQVRPRTEGWTQRVDAEGKPLLQFAAPKKGMPPTHLADLARELGVASSLTVTGFLPTSLVCALYRRADLVLQPSESEGFGLP